MVFFSLVAILFNIVIGIAIYPYLTQLKSLLNSRYEYSVIAKDVIGTDDYYKYDAGICFTTSENKDNSINADIVMQVEETCYSDNVSWNVEDLSKYEVAISEGIANDNQLSVGDFIFSKHIVNGEVHNYLIARIIPDQLVTRVVGTSTYSKGIIIMGFDDEYKNNISYECLTFTDGDINALTNYSPTNIIYREDEIITMLLGMIPYLILIVFVSALIAFIELIVNCKAIKANFIRLAMLGVDRRNLNNAYFRCLWSYSIASILVGVVASYIALTIIRSAIVAVFIASIVIVTEICTFSISIFFTNKQLWRK